MPVKAIVGNHSPVQALCVRYKLHGLGLLSLVDLGRATSLDLLWLVVDAESGASGASCVVEVGVLLTMPLLEIRLVPKTALLDSVVVVGRGPPNWPCLPWSKTSERDLVEWSCAWSSCHAGSGPAMAPRQAHTESDDAGPRGPPMWWRCQLLQST